MPEIITELGLTEAQAAKLVRKLRDHDDFDMRKIDAREHLARKRANDMRRMERHGRGNSKIKYQGSMDLGEYLRLVQKEGIDGANAAFDWFLKRHPDFKGR